MSAIGAAAYRFGIVVCAYLGLLCVYLWCDQRVLPPPSLVRRGRRAVLRHGPRFPTDVCDAAATVDGGRHASGYGRLD